MSGLSLIFPFVDSSANFAYGFEAGKLYQQMRDGVPEIEGTFHFDNYEQFKLMAEACQYSVSSFNNVGDGWIGLKFTKAA